MAKAQTQYECGQCGAVYSKWQGQCESCGAWNSLVEVRVASSSKKQFGARSGPGAGRYQKLSEVDISAKSFSRLDVGSKELSQVLGGGMVKGSLVLLAGEPGIGKSTLLSQLTLYFASKHGRVLYVCGEESPQQVKLRLERLSGHKKTTLAAKDNILLLSETDTDTITATMEDVSPSLTIIDSIQSMTCADLTGMAGSVGQVRESSQRIMRTAKAHSLSTFVVGHVTKEGSVAGPKVLEHMVDGVFALEGERSGDLRLLRSLKNRFGAVDEVGVFSMSDTGLTDITDPTSIFIQDQTGSVAGSATTVLMEGTRPIMAEIQALVVPTNLPTPRRVAEGVRLSRLQVICAVLTKHGRINLNDKDVFVNVVGGLKAYEPAADLAIALAIASSAQEKPVVEKTVAVGELGLLGEVRPVSFGDKREREAKKLNYHTLPIKSSRINAIIKQALG